jgi:hypothetical protein
MAEQESEIANRNRDPLNIIDVQFPDDNNLLGQEDSFTLLAKTRAKIPEL